MQIIINGLASGKRQSFTLETTSFQLSLLEFLQLKEIPIASSCSGKGVCKKCITSEGELSCKILIKNISHDCEFSFDYL